MCFSNKHLFGKGVCRCRESIALTVDCGVCTAPNCVHFPVSVVIVYHMEVSMPAPAFIHPFIDIHFLMRQSQPLEWRERGIYLPGHSLHKTFPKMIKCNRDLHVNIGSIAITVTQQHHLQCSHKNRATVIIVPRDCNKSWNEVKILHI